MPAAQNVLKGIRSAFASICRKNGGLVRGLTCFISPEGLYYTLDDLAEEVRYGRVKPGFAKLKFVSESVEAGKTRRTTVDLITSERTVNVFATVASETHDKLSKWFTWEGSKGNIRAEGTYHIDLDNEFILRAHGSRETTWDNLSDDTRSLITELEMEAGKKIGVEREAWYWFRRKVEESRDWLELTKK